MTTAPYRATLIGTALTTVLGMIAWDVGRPILWPGAPAWAAHFGTLAFTAAVAALAAARVSRCLRKLQDAAQWQDEACRRAEEALAEMEERRNASQRTEDRLRLFEAALVNATAAVAILEVTPAGPQRFVWVNQAFTRLTAYAPEAVLGGTPELLHGAQPDADTRLEGRYSREAGTVELESYREDGTPFWIEMELWPVRDAGGQVTHLVSVQRDVTDRKSAETERDGRLLEALERADTDPLTGLFNHRAFHKRLEEEADRAQRFGEPLAMAVLDLDNFKFFNDSYGHAVGDDVLRQVASALRASSRSYDVLSRFGGDEFAMLMPGMGADEAAGFAQRLAECLAGVGYRPPGYDVVIPMEVSFGIAIFPDDAPTRLDVLELADGRLRRAKGRRHGERENVLERLQAQFSRSLEGFSMLSAMVSAVDNKDRYTRRHSEDVVTYCLEICRELGLDEDTQQTVQIAALLHDVGKIGVPDAILRKPGKLTDEEQDAVQQHAVMGASIVGAVPGFEATLPAIRHHHERWDGLGYPLGQREDEIPFLARLLAVADAYSAMTTDRPYRKGMDPNRALDILARGSGIQWDPACVAAFLRARGTPLAVAA